MESSPEIALVVGLGNPGSGYAQTRHNVGFWLVDRIAESAGSRFRPEARFHGELCEAWLGGLRLRLLKPTTYMNRCGRSVAATASFFRFPPEALLVVHDDLDLPVGTLRCKRGGGHGGHNGLRDIVAHLGSSDFARLRIGIGHPGHRDDVTGHVLSRPSGEDRAALDDALEAALAELPDLVGGGWQRAMQALHRRGKP